mmetsp:Transcript_22401/g.32654  ORF Transcript_22401/g.32654 Transcript_22401/m.32654 type:complete len:367 (+) Transcript_22401:73-1173(+)|eukprot:CAMPEP_0185026476 /NCGR_PEP_ID=MMETSP1103-20130426/10742_1 /TAXON_ID=36769 /ORGANISM="Paraphysomonas bandaiensis, Strain Caron Lab Isolate" /LENGTH=366 /DNA_ID=CAMNT_0027560075 /DNA_START=51 /DNA_END=1151 /DNA_ORIENTATION=+
MGSTLSSNLPEKIHRIVLTQPHEDLSKAKLDIEEIPMPVPRIGQVLIRVSATPVNPSDYGEWSNVPRNGEFQPRPVGKEGSGVVVASGGGIYANSIVGKKVGFVSNVKGQGAYAEYTVVDALKGVFPLPDNVVVEDAASHFVNPYTAYGFVDTVRTRHVGTSRPGLVHTAAASQLGQMLVKLCKQENVQLLNIVRREEQAETLRKLGAEHIIISTAPNWEETLRDKIKELGIQIAFDAIGGEMTGTLLSNLPPKGTCFVYGRLSNQNCSGIAPLDLIYRGKKLEGFFLTSWLMGSDSLGMLMRVRAATACVHAGLENQETGWAVSQFEDCSLDNMWEKFVDMWNESGFTGRKLRIRFKDQETSDAN